MIFSNKNFPDNLFFNPKDLTAISRAAVPLDTAMPYFL